MGIRLFVATLASAIVLAACGGGGGGTTPPTTSLPEYPTLVPSAAFSLPTLAAAPEHVVVAGTQQGRVVVAPGVAAVGGLTVDWLDASTPSSPVVLATTTTRADGTFSLSTNTGTIAPTDQWLRATLGDGTVLRAYATGWVEVSPGTDAALREIARLRQAGAFTAHVLAAAELAGAQESATLAWLTSPVTQSPGPASDVLVEHLRYLAPWNKLLDAFALAIVSQGAGDISGLFPVGDTFWPSTVRVNAATSAATYRSTCFAPPTSTLESCGIQSSDAPGIAADTNPVRSTGVGRIQPDGRPNFNQALVQVRELPLIEFPYVVGSRVLYENAAFILPLDHTIHAAIKVIRRTYPAEAIAALGGTVQAVKVVLDFEVALLDTVSAQQSDILVRETRWYSPGNGRVRYESTTLSRTAPQTTIADGLAPVTSSSVSVLAAGVSGTFFAPAAIPFAGVADVVSLGLRHRHAVYSAALNRIFVAIPANGGEILELDPATLAIGRTLPTGAVPGRLAVSADGTQLYAGLDGGELAQWRIADFALVHRTTLPLDSSGDRYRRVYDIAIDPFDVDRALVLAGGNNFGNSGALLIYRQGALVLRDAPRYYALDWGWGYYSPNAVAWSPTVHNEYVAGSLGSPQSIYRFRANEASGVNTDVSSLLRVSDVGWQEIGSSILTNAGRLLDPVTFAQQGELTFASTPLAKCRRQDATMTNTDLCQLALYWPTYVRLDHATSLFRGTYRPVLANVVNGCNGAIVSDSIALSGLVLTPMSVSRSLASTWDTGGADELCSLQVWTLHGAH